MFPLRILPGGLPIFELTQKAITNARGKMILMKEVMEGNFL